MASSRKKSGQSQCTKRQATFDVLMQSDEPLVEAIRNFDDEDFIESNDSTQTIPQEYCLISEAVHKLEKSMFGNLNRPDAVVEIKKVQRDASIGLSSHREAAKRLILKAAVKGKLIVYRLRPNVSAIEPIEPRFISKIMLVRSGLPDHVGHLVQANANSPAKRDLQVDLRDNVLLLKRDEFEDWRVSERSKRKWPSQEAYLSKAPKRGRPKILREHWNNLIIDLVKQNKWHHSLGVPALRIQLITVSSAQFVPSEDTLARILHCLYEKTQDSKILPRPGV